MTVRYNLTIQSFTNKGLKSEMKSKLKETMNWNQSLENN